MDERQGKDDASNARQRAMALNNKGLMLAREKRFEEALPCFEEALSLFRKENEPVRAAEQWGNIGSVYRDLERHEKAIESYHNALSIYTAHGLFEGVADQFTNIAYIHAMKGSFREALEWYRKAVPLYEEAKSGKKLAFTRQNVEGLERGLEDASSAGGEGGASQ
jgi:tetratricopeptide (TPR) repeat protein